MGDTKREYRVCWGSNATGETGRGIPLPKSTAEAWAEHGNEQWGDEIVHWVERVHEGEAND